MNNHHLFWFLICVAVFLMGMVFGAVIAEQGFKSIRQDYEWMKRTYLYRSGFTGLLPWLKQGEHCNYQIRSWDAGKTWYAINTENDKLVILGEADKIYPGLIKHLNAWDGLTKHVEQYGPLGLDNAKDIGMIEAVGFQVKSN